MHENLLWAFGLTTFAGLCTGIGGAIAFFAKKTNTRLLAVSLGFSAGVMVYISMTEIMSKSRQYLSAAWGDTAGGWATAGAFFGGILLTALIDKLVPSFENPHESRGIEEMERPRKKDQETALLRMGVFSGLAIAIHNFPEGLATFVAALDNPMASLPIVAAIAIHNIPEGISVSVPIFYATGSRGKAFFYSFLSGLAEPAGALIGYLFLMSVLNDATFGLLFGMVGGIMVFISFDELLPAAHKYGEHHLAVYGLIAGMAVMAVSLLAFG
ncbi:MAG: zinc transporter ZupT [Elusimicrobiota bacterium]